MTNTTPERVQILTEASGLITGQRQQDYGTPEVNFQRMADYANIHFARNLETNTPFNARQMAEYMILLKMARTINSPTRDSYVDIAGYGGIAGELANIETAKKEASNTTGGTWEESDDLSAFNDKDFHDRSEAVVSHPAVLLSLSNPANTGSVG
jgi:hypothetical protein